MKKLNLILGAGMASLLLMSFNVKNNCANIDGPCPTILTPTETYSLFEDALLKDEAARNLGLNEITVIEVEDEIVLDFDTIAYLPLGFNPYTTPNLNLNDIVIVEMEEEIVLDFDTAKYLPLGFNPYAKAQLNLNDIKVENPEEEIHLGFDVLRYLPKGFDPYSK